MIEDIIRKNRILAVVRGRRSAASENDQHARDSDDALNFEDKVCFVNGYHDEEGSQDTMQITENQMNMMVIPDYTSLVLSTDLDDELAKGETGAELHRVSDPEHALKGRQVTVSDFLESDSIAVKVEKPLLSMVEKMEIIDRIRSARGGRRLRNKQQLERSFEFLKQVLVEGDMKWLTPVLLAALLGAAAGGLAPFAIVYCESSAIPSPYSVHQSLIGPANLHGFGFYAMQLGRKLDATRQQHLQHSLALVLLRPWPQT